MMSIGDNLSASIGMIDLVTLPIAIILSVVLFLFIKNNGLLEKYGFCKSEVSASKMLYYIPILLMFTANFWYGIAFNLSLIETVLYILTMFCVGFLEEVIFRGLLFKAMAKDDMKSAVIVSSLYCNT